MTDERRDEPQDAAVVEAVWRRVSREEPAARVDAAILAAARAELRRAPAIAPAAVRRSRWTVWQPLAAAAGVAALAFALVQMIPREEPVPAARVPADSAPAAPVPAAPATETMASRPAPEQRRASAPVAATADVASARSAEAPAPAAAAREDAPAALAALAPEAWAARIAGLHSSGDVETAAAELSAFRRAHPDADAYLPQGLRAWAASVPAPAAP